MVLLTRFCIANSKRDYGKNSVDRDQTPENLVPSHKIMIIYIFYSFWRMAKNSFFTYEFGTLKSFNTH